LLNNVNEVGGVAAQRRTDYQALTWIPQLSSSQCAVTPISEQWLMPPAYPLWWRVWRPT